MSGFSWLPRSRKKETALAEAPDRSNVVSLAEYRAKLGVSCEVARSDTCRSNKDFFGSPHFELVSDYHLIVWVPLTPSGVAASSHRSAEFSAFQDLWVLVGFCFCEEVEIGIAYDHVKIVIRSADPIFNEIKSKTEIERGVALAWVGRFGFAWLGSFPSANKLAAP